MIELTRDQIEEFRGDGFLIVPRLVEPAVADRVAARYERLFRGEFETGIEPDEWNWREGRDGADRTRQICNGWKADYTIANLALREDVGRACALLAGWPGAPRPGRQRVVEAGGREVAGLPPGLQLPRMA